MPDAEVKRCKYHCDYGDGKFCYYEGPGGCVNNASNIPQKKPPIGCKPYVTISERIDELYDAIRKIIAEKEKHNHVKFWSNEIVLLNEMVRFLRRAEEEKAWIEDKDATLKDGEIMLDRNIVIKNLKWFRDRKSWREGITIHDDNADVRKQICDNAIAMLKENEPVQPIYITTFLPFRVGIDY